MLIKPFFVDHYRAYQTAVHYFARTPYAIFISVIAIGLSLTLPLSLYLLVDNVQTLYARWDQQASMTIYLDPKCTLTQVNYIVQDIKKNDFVKKVTYIDPDSALREFQQASAIQDVLPLLNDNPLPSVIAIEFDPNTGHFEAFEALKRDLSAKPKVLSVRFDYDWLQRLHAFISVAQTACHLFCILIGLGLIVVIGNTIRHAFDRHHDEVEVLTLIGATDAYIRRPFLYRGILLGGGGGLVALLMLVLGLLALRRPVEVLASTYQSSFQLQGLCLTQIFGFLLLSALLGGIGASLAFWEQRAIFARQRYTRAL